MSLYPPDNSKEQDDPPHDDWTPDPSLRRVVCAANRNRDSGRLICGPRHWDRTMRQQRHPEESFNNWDQGFIDQFGIFMSREEAYEVAERQGQIRQQCGPEAGRTLYSEHLY